MQKRIECIVTGRVQMVMFRDFVSRNARSLGIAGTVENRDDGSVFVVAEGEETKLDELISRLRKGPLLARVDSVHVEWHDATGGITDFQITYASKN